MSMLNLQNLFLDYRTVHSIQRLRVTHTGHLITERPRERYCLRVRGRRTITTKSVG